MPYPKPLSQLPKDALGRGRSLFCGLSPLDGLPTERKSALPVSLSVLLLVKKFSIAAENVARMAPIMAKVTTTGLAEMRNKKSSMVVALE
jgi:hypothetical protein